MPNINYPTNDPIFPALLNAIETGRCTAFIGSGVSADDFPTWKELIEELVDKCEVKPEEPKSDNFLDIAEAAYNNNSNSYHQTLTSQLRLPNLPLSANRYHCLARINFAGYINFNFDHLLIHHLSMHKNIEYSTYPLIMRDGLTPKNHEVFHVHGHIPPDRNSNECELVFRRSEFDTAYSDGRLSNFLMDILQNNHACFIGFNPSEPHFMKILELCKIVNKAQHGLDDNSRPWWYLLTPNEEINTVDLHNSGVRHVSYDKIDESYSGLDRILNFCAKIREPKLKTPGIHVPFASTERPSTP